MDREPSTSLRRRRWGIRFSGDCAPDSSSSSRFTRSRGCGIPSTGIRWTTSISPSTKLGIVFSPFGETLTILGGSAFQVIVPLAFVIYFARTKQRYAAAVTTSWVGVNLLNVAKYIGDARAQDLPLLGGEDSIHDWWYLLINWDALPSDTVIARWVHFFGVVAFLVAIIGGLMTLRYGGSRTRCVIPSGGPTARSRGIAVVPTEGSLYRDDGDSSCPPGGGLPADARSE